MKIKSTLPSNEAHKANMECVKTSVIGRVILFHASLVFSQSNEAESSTNTTTTTTSTGGGADKPLVNGQPLLFGTVNGMVGTILTLTEDNYRVLAQLQTAMTKVVKGVGGFSHDEWRSFTNGRRTSPASNFIDGDLLESYLDMPRSKQEEALRHMNASMSTNMPGEQLWEVESLIHRVEEMQRLH